MLMELLWHENSQTVIAGTAITEIRIRAPKDGAGGPMVIVKAVLEDGPAIAFSSADRANDALLSILERIQNRDVNWREDKPYGT